MTFTNDIRTGQSGLADRMIGFFRSMIVPSEKSRLYRQTLNELRALSDRELADLGIHRAMIVQIARDAVESK